ncbi:MAG: hypothetical protein WC628_00780 [Candidatus Omnitrophota bacterium]
MWGCKRKNYWVLSQSTIEYFIIFTIVAAAVVASGIIFPRSGEKTIFEECFNKAVVALQ